MKSGEAFVSHYIEQTYVHQSTKAKQHQVCKCVHVSSFSGLSLFEYITARAVYCSARHACPCVCHSLIEVGKVILDKGYCNLSDAFRRTSPTVKYSAEHARRNFLHMPLLSVCIGDPAKGQSFSILLEKFSGMDYSKIG